MSGTVSRFAQRRPMVGGCQEVRVATTKASFNLPDEDLEQLRRLAAERNVTMTQALRQAIADSSFLSQQAETHNKLLVETPDGRVREIVIHR